MPEEPISEHQAPFYPRHQRLTTLLERNFDKYGKKGDVLVILLVKLEHTDLNP